MGTAVVASITLPDALTYQFCYDGAVSQAAYCTNKSISQPAQWGQLSDVILPTGGYVHYGFPTNPNITGAAFPIFPISSKTLIWTDPADSAQRTEVSSYSFTNTSSMFTNPDGGQVTHYFYDTLDTNPDWYTGLVYETASAPSGDVLEQFWAPNVPFAATLSYPTIHGSGNAYVQTEMKSSVDTNGSPVLTSGKVNTVDRNGNQTTVAEYDWFAYGSAGHLSSGTSNGAPPARLPGTSLKVSDSRSS